MVIEHVFVTTIEEPDALSAASEFLAAGGFAPSLQQVPGSLQMRRGELKPARAKSISQLPQIARLDWDRGRVTVALSIEPSLAWGGSGISGFFGWQWTITENRRRMRLHAEMLSAIANGLQSLLAHRQPAQIAKADWDLVESRIASAARRRLIWRRIFLIVAILFFILAIVLVIETAHHR